jgi:phenylacetate-coenzyme A ligase PaaK-like adenylate-forming protein
MERSPFFRRKYHGIDLARLELARLPPCRKEELIAHFDETVTDRRIHRNELEQFLAHPGNLGRWYLGRYAVSHTSGSQGPPMLIVQDHRCLEVMFALLSSRANATGRPGIVEGLRRWRSPARVAIITMRRGFYPSGAAYEFMPEFVGPYAQVLRLSSMQSDLIERLNEFQPNILVGYASVLEALTLQSHRLRLSCLRQIANSCEQLTVRARTRIREAFDVPLLDHYGIGECLLLSEGCPTDVGAHVNADWAILEVVDEQFRPVPRGQVGAKVLITNLANTVQPIIRYEVEDCLVMADRPCACGSRLPRIERIEGRAAEVFWTREQDRYRLISGVLFHNVADSLHEIQEWQAVQHERNRIEVRLQLLPGARLSPETVCHAFQQGLQESELPQNVAVDVHIVTALTSDSTTGKFRRMINCVGPPDDLRRTKSCQSQAADPT